ncbi:MAG: hypothetical protein LAN62_17890 [Acidobacteriia bacterium]|nr:hypothetical protein [Terriglobia bacterium]
MATKLSRYFDIPATRLRKLGVFNALIGLDNSLFVDPHLLKLAKVREFRGSRAELERYFSEVIHLLKASKYTHDLAWNEALNRLAFREEHGAALGYSGVGGHGKAIGRDLAERLCDRAAEIVALGIEDPVIFELIPLFEDGFGADRLSDMAVAILRKRFLAYTQRVALNLGLSKTREFPIRGRSFQLPVHPDGKTPFVFVPSELLNDLPVALSRSEIDAVAEINDEVRRAWSEIVWAAARKKRSPAKSEIRQMFLANRKNFDDLISIYRKETAAGYDFAKDPRGLFDWDEIGREFAQRFPLKIEIKRPTTLSELRVVVDAIIEQFKRNVEENGLFEVLYDDRGKPRRERFSQRLFYAIADSYCAANNVDISREPDAGSGPVDFKLASAYDARVLVEVKLSSHPRLMHGFETQLPTYQKSEGTEQSVYLIVRVPGSDRVVKNVLKLRDKKQADGQKVADVYVVDARPKKSASKR